MIRDHRPYWLKRASRRIEELYVRRKIAPQLDSLGPGYYFAKPWHVEIFGSPINIGRCVNVIASHDMKVRISIWGISEGEGRITIGDNCLICPGVRLGSATEIIIEDNCMLAHASYVTDSDWHDIYNRIIPCQKPAPVHIKQNAWVGDSAIICKGVTIGENSVVGAGAVVTSDVPPNTVAAGNPARVVKELDPNEEFITRADFFSDPVKLSKEIKYIDKMMHQGNSTLHWLRHMFFPAKGE